MRVIARMNLELHRSCARLQLYHQARHLARPGRAKEVGHAQRLRHCNAAHFFPVLVGECMPFLASGSEHTMTVSARAYLQLEP